MGDSTEGTGTQAAEPLIYWAVVLQHRWWCWFDGVERYRVSQKGLDGPAVRRIAKAYGVARGLSLKREKGADGKKIRQRADMEEAALTQRAADIAELLSEAAKDWGTDLLARHDACVGVVGEAKKQKLIDKKQISAVTKLMWFLKPERWTMFDDRAATGLGISVGTTKAGSRAKRFYTTLRDKGFETLAARIEVELRDAGVEIPAERVLDSYLMLRADRLEARNKGAEATEGNEATARAYLEVLDAPLQNRLREAATRVAKAVPNPFDLEAA